MRKAIISFYSITQSEAVTKADAIFNNLSGFACTGILRHAQENKLGLIRLPVSQMQVGSIYTLRNKKL